MTHETRTRKVVEKQEVVVKETEVEFDLVEEEIEGVRCDFCSQWYSDDEDVDITELVEDPSIEGLPSDPMRLYKLLEHIEIREITATPGSHRIDGIPLHTEARKSMNKPALLWRSLKEFVEERGGPRQHLMEMREEDVAAAAAYGRVEQWTEGDIIFNFDLDLEVGGRVRHMCEYCQEGFDDR